MKLIDLIILILFILSICFSIYNYTTFSKYKVVGGVYYIGNDTAMIDMKGSFSDVMRRCSHEYEHHIYTKDHWDTMYEVSIS